MNSNYFFTIFYSYTIDLKKLIMKTRHYLFLYLMSLKQTGFAKGLERWYMSCEKRYYSSRVQYDLYFTFTDRWYCFSSPHHFLPHSYSCPHRPLPHTDSYPHKAFVQPSGNWTNPSLTHFAFLLISRSVVFHLNNSYYASLSYSPAINPPSPPRHALPLIHYPRDSMYTRNRRLQPWKWRNWHRDTYIFQQLANFMVSSLHL